MTRDDIIRMAREAGLIHYHDSEGHWSGVTNDNMIDVEENRWDDKLVKILQPFASLVAAAEREACAEFLIDLYESDGYYHPAEEFAENAAAAIRARGQ